MPLTSRIIRSWTEENIVENVSDHLPLSISLQLHIPLEHKPGVGKVDEIDWTQDLTGNVTALYRWGVQLIVGPSLDSDCQPGNYACS